MSDQSESISDLAEALSLAQGKMAGAKKDARNPHLNNSYADLASIWDACREPLSSNGLAVTQTTVEAPAGSLAVKTTLMHRSGQYISGTIFLPWEPSKGLNPAQAFGSALTYARRYSLSAIVGIAPAEDDGASAGTPDRPNRNAGRTADSSRPAPRQYPNADPATGEIPEPQKPKPQTLEEWKLYFSKFAASKGWTEQQATAALSENVSDGPEALEEVKALALAVRNGSLSADHFDAFAPVDNPSPEAAPAEGFADPFPPAVEPTPEPAKAKNTAPVSPSDAELAAAQEFLAAAAEAGLTGDRAKDVVSASVLGTTPVQRTGTEGR